MFFNKSGFSNNWLFVFFFSFLFYACNSKQVVYRISNKYVGPCVVFIYESENVRLNSTDTIDLVNGLGRISSDKMKNKFIFQSNESSKELEVVPIGKEAETTDKERYIYRLGKSSSSSSCITNDLEKISFFVGTKLDLKEWSSHGHYDGLNYFDSIGIDWCKYYRSVLKD